MHPSVSQRPEVRVARAFTGARSQAALVRTLLDELDRVAPAEGEALNAQLAEELALLAARCSELSRALAATESEPPGVCDTLRVARCA